MFKSVSLLSLVGTLVAVPALADTSHLRDVPPVETCLLTAAKTYRLPPVVLVVILTVEGGRLGAASINSDGSTDIGPMQVNDRWLPELEAHWQATLDKTYTALRNDTCANIDAGAWILSQYIAEANGDLWEGVGRYHSHLSGEKLTYLTQVLAAARRLHLTR